MMAATRGAMLAQRSRRAIERRMRRESTSSSPRASSWRTAQATSASSCGMSSASGRSRSSSRPSARTSRACVPWRSTRAARPCRVEAFLRGQLGREAIELVAWRCAQQREAGRRGARRWIAALERHVHGVAGHEPVGGVLAAGDPHQPGGLAMDGVLAADAGRVTAGRADQGSQAGIGTQSVLAREVEREHAVDGLEDVIDLVPGGRRTVGCPGVRLIGGAHDPGPGGGDEEEHAAGDLERHARPDGDAFSLEEQVRPAAGHELHGRPAQARLRVPEPDARGVDDPLGPDGQLLSAEEVADREPGDAAVVGPSGGRWRGSSSPRWRPSRWPCAPRRCCSARRPRRHRCRSRRRAGRCRTMGGMSSATAPAPRWCARPPSRAAPSRS